jgi:hypothetical protein
VTAVIEAFRSAGCDFLTTDPPGTLTEDSKIDISHEALIRRWQRLCDPARDPASKEPVGWMWREFEDGQRWRALAVQGRLFRDDASRSATLSPATTEAYGSWWTAHSAAWAARYARDAESASAEYEEVQKLWQASQQALEQERARLGREAEAKAMVEASRRVAQRTLAGLAAAVVLALIAIASGIYARFQRDEANLQRSAAEEQETLAEANFREAQKTESYFRAAQAKEAGADAVTAALLALEGLPDSTSADVTYRTRPFVNEAWNALYRAHLDQRERAILRGHTPPVTSAVFAP